MQEGKKPRAVWIRRIAWAAAGLLLLGWMVPMLVRLNYWQEEITTSLSEAFHRPVRTGDIRPQLLGGLGFDIENVILEEDPRFGIEPFARMESLQARVALRSLFGGGVEFSSLTFVRPSLNVVRNAAGEWNLESFGRKGSSLADDLASEASDEEVIHTVLPQIRIESGRVNFKAASYKRAFTLNSLDLELSPPKVPHQPWAFRFEGTPGRTDIPLRFGDRWAGEGEFGPFTSQIQEETGIPLRLDWWTEDVLLAELLSVFAGRDFGVHGTVSLQGHLAGTTSLLRLTARTELRDAHRWDLVPSREARVIPGEVSGFLDLKDDSLQLTSISIPVGDGSVVLRGRVEDLLDNPRLETEAELRQVPVAAVAEVARRFTTRLNPRLAAQGTLNGHARISGSVEALSTEDLSGAVEVSGAILRDTESSETIRFSKFPVVMQSGAVAFGPLDASLGQGNLRKGGPVRLAARWDFAAPSSELHLRGSRIPLVFLQHWVQRLGAGWRYASAERGDLALQLDVLYRNGEVPRIGGWAEVSGAVLRTEGTNQPVRIPEAHLVFQRDSVRAQPLSAALGPIELQGSLVAKWAPAGSDVSGFGRAVSSVEFELATPGVDIGELAGLLGVAPEPTGFLSWFRRGREPGFPLMNLPPIQGVLNAASIRYRGFEWKDVAASLRWQERQLEVAEFAGEFAGGMQRGRASVSFGPASPAFTLEARYSDLDLETLTASAPTWSGSFSGKLSGELRLAGRGGRPDEVMKQLSGSGQVRGRHVALLGLDLKAASEGEPAPETRFSNLSAAFQIAENQVQISEMTATSETSPRPNASSNASRTLLRPSWRISGTVGFDRSLDLLVQQEPEGTEWRWAGSLSEPRITQSNTRVTASESDASLPR